MKIREAASAAKFDPYRAAADMGVEVIRCELFTTEGFWMPDQMTVVLAKGACRTRERCALAHQLAHIVLGHEVVSAVHEWQADRVAATHMIRMDEFEFWYPRCGSLPELAFELGVTPKMTLAYVGMLGSARVRVPVA